MGIIKVFSGFLGSRRRAEQNCGDSTDPRPNRDLAEIARISSPLEEWCRRPEIVEMVGLCFAIDAAWHLRAVAKHCAASMKDILTEWRREVERDSPATTRAFREAFSNSASEVLGALKFSGPIIQRVELVADLRRLLERLRALKDLFNDACDALLDPEDEPALIVDPASGDLVSVAGRHEKAIGMISSMLREVQAIEQELHEWEQTATERVIKRREKLVLATDSSPARDE